MNIKYCFCSSILIVTLFISNSLSAQESDDPLPAVKVVAEARYQKEITAIVEHPKVKAAFKEIVDLEPATIKDVIKLTQIPAPPFKEKIRGEKYKQMLQQIGVDSIWVDVAGNVIALKKGTKGNKTVVIEGHLDTVFPEGTDVNVKQRGDTLFAPGIGDDSRGLAVVLAVLKSIQKTKIKTESNILFVGTTGEEGLGDLRGVKQLFNTPGLKIDSYISIDGSGIGHIVNGAVGSHRYRITFKGPGGHSYGKFGVVNPHNAAAHTTHYFIAEADKYTRQGVKTTYNIGVIGGGTSVNAIPFESWMEVDMRSESAERLNGLDQLLQAAIQKGLREENSIKRSGEDLTVEIKLVGDRPAGVQDKNLGLIQRTIAAQTALGITSTFASSSTNANTPISLGVPGINIGNGGKSGGAHSLNEWWLNDKGYLAIQNALLILLAEAKMVK